MNQNRRSTDSLTDISDHDLLIKNTVQIENIHEKIDIFILCMDKKVDSSFFRWFVSVVIIALISLSGTIWQANNNALATKSDVAVNTQMLKGK